MSRENDDIIMERNANHLIIAGENVLGKLVLTNKSLIFKPSSLTSLFYRGVGKEVTINISDIEDIGKKQSLFGLSKHIWVKLKGGQLEHFALRRIDELVDAVKKQMGSK